MKRAAWKLSRKIRRRLGLVATATAGLVAVHSVSAQFGSFQGVYNSAPIYDAFGVVLPGSNPAQSNECAVVPGCVVEILQVGSGGVAHVANLDGSPSGGDTLLFTTFIGQGEPCGTTGEFSTAFSPAPSSGTVIYGRAFNQPTVSNSTYWGQSSNFTSTGGTSQMNLSALGLNATTMPKGASFTASPTNGLAPLHVNFTDNTVAPVTNRFWSFGDGGTTNFAVATNPTHTYKAGTYNVTLIVSGSVGASTNVHLNYITATCPAITVSPSNLPNATVAASYSYQLTASGGQSPYTYTNLTGSLPAGLSLSSGGLISGTPTSDSTASFAVTATDSNGCTGVQSYTVTPSCPTITVLGTLPNGTVDASYGTQTVTASGANGSYTFARTSGTLPAGLSLNTANGQITGTPTSDASQTFTITATDSSGCTGSNSFTVTPACPTLTLTPAAGALTAGTLGTAYSQTFTASGAENSFTYSKTSGTLPTGLSLSSSGVLSGTPTVSSSYSFTVTATDSSGCSIAQAYTLQTSCPTITVSLLSVNNSALPFGVSNQTYSATNNLFAASGSAATPYAFTSGTLPTGLTLATNGALSGTPTTTNTVTFSVTAMDTNGCTGSASYTITNGWAVAVTTPPTNTTVCSGSTASFTVAATGTGPLSYAWRKNGAGWGSPNAWTFVNTANCTTRGYYVNADPTNCAEQTISPGIGNDSYYSGGVYGLFANGGDDTEVTRNFSDLPVGQSVVIDYQNPVDMATNVINGGPTVALFALRDASGTARFEFYVNGGDTQYTINDANPLANSSGIPYTSNGLHLILTLTGANTYNLQVQDLASGKWYTYVNRTLGGTSGNAISQLRFFYRNTGDGGTACQDFFFNVLSVGAYSDLAGNYTTGDCGTTSWTNNSNEGAAPLFDGNGISGSATTNLQISDVQSGDAGNYDVIVANAYGSEVSKAATLSVPTVGTAGTITGATNNVCPGATNVTYSIASVSGATGYDWVVPSGASITAGSNTTEITVTFGNNSGEVEVTPVNGSCSGTVSSTPITLNANPTVTATSNAQIYDGAYQILQGQTVVLSASTVGGATAYNWSLNGGGTFSNNQTVSSTPAVGTNTYTVTVPTSCGTAVGSTNVTVLASTDGVIADLWKTEHGYATNAASSTVSSNGLSLLQSWYAGLDPTNPASVLDWSSLSVTPAGMVTVVWQSAQDGTTPTRLYDFYRLSAPYTTGASWSRIYSNVAPAGATTPTNDNAAGVSQRFYRVTIAGHTNDVATIGIAGVQMLRLQAGYNYISMSTTQSPPTLLSVLATNQLPQSDGPPYATEVAIWDQVNQCDICVTTNLFWLSTSGGWEQIDSLAPSDDFVLDPTKGMIVYIQSSSPTNYVTGFVPTSAEIQAVESNGYTVGSSTYPQPITLNNSGLSNAITGGTSLNNSDNLLFYDPTTQAFDIRTWYYNGDGTWRDANAVIVTNQIQLQPGAAFLIQRRSRSTNLIWTNPVPYNVNPLPGP